MRFSLLTQRLALLVCLSKVTRAVLFQLPRFGNTMVSCIAMSHCGWSLYKRLAFAKKHNSFETRLISERFYQTHSINLSFLDYCWLPASDIQF